MPLRSSHRHDSEMGKICLEVPFLLLQSNMKPLCLLNAPPWGDSQGPSQKCLNLQSCLLSSPVLHSKEEDHASVWGTRVMMSQSSN